MKKLGDTTPEKQVILLVFHGSPYKIYEEDLENFLSKLRPLKPPNTEIEVCFIEHQKPEFGKKIEELSKNKEISQVFIDPIFLFRARHMKYDIEPKFMAVKNGYRFFLHPVLGEREHFMELYSCFVKNYIEKVQIKNPEKCLFLFVGRGTSDEGAAGDFYKFSRIVWEKMGKPGQIMLSFAEVTKPSPSEILSVIRTERFEKILVIPILIFRGHVEKKIEEECKSVKNIEDKLEFLPPIGYAYAENFAKFLIRPYLLFESNYKYKISY